MVASGAWLFATASLVLVAVAAFGAGLLWARLRQSEALRALPAPAPLPPAAPTLVPAPAATASPRAETAAPSAAEAAPLLELAPGPALLARADAAGTWQVLHANRAACARWPAGAGLPDWATLRESLPPTLRAAVESAAAGPAPGGGEAAADPAAEGWSWRRIDVAGRPPGLLLSQAPDASERTAAEQAAFSYTVSHDLRAPIRVVEGFTRILKEDYGRLLDRVGNEHIDRVLSAAARMDQMIDAMLTLARLSSQPLARQPVNLSQLAGWIIDDLRRAAPEREADIEIDPALAAHGDPTLLRLVLENLLGNAWKYTQRAPRARIVLAAETVRAGAPPGLCAFVVRDNGAGFDMRSAERLFGLFQRLHSASEFPGTGVGLASVRRIVQRHGGDIWAEAEPGRGASFHFTLGR